MRLVRKSRSIDSTISLLNHLVLTTVAEHVSVPLNENLPLVCTTVTVQLGGYVVSLAIMSVTFCIYFKIKTVLTNRSN